MPIYSGDLGSLGSGLGKLGSGLGRLGSSLDKPKRVDLRSSTGLYQTAKELGLQKDADRALKEQAGEHPNQIFSGGFISDIFDVLNAAQYGIVGMLKGKSFLDGIKSRSSFSDKDSLGKHGIPGVIAGMIADIAFDPFTYIAPWTQLKKISAVEKGAKAVEEFTIGKKVVKGIVDASGKTTRHFVGREGGTWLGRGLAETFSYKFGKDPVYLDLVEKSHAAANEAINKSVEVVQKMVKLDPELASKLIKRLPDGTIIRRNIDELKKILSPEEFELARKAFSNIDEEARILMQEGSLSKEKFEQNFGQYLTQIYNKERKLIKKVFPSKKFGVRPIMARRTAEEWAAGYLKSLPEDVLKKEYPKAISETLTEYGKISLKNLSKDEIDKISSIAKKEYEQVDDAAVLLAHTAVDLIRRSENVKLAKKVRKLFGTTIKQPGFVQVPKSKRFATNSALVAYIRRQIKDVNQAIKEPFRNLKSTFKADKSLTTEQNQLQRSISDLLRKQEKEFGDFFQVGETVEKTSEVGRKIQGASKLPSHLQEIGRQIEKLPTKEFDKIPKNLQIKLEKLHTNGDLERAGFKSINDFVDFIKTPYKKTGGLTREVLIKDNTKKIISLQKRAEKLMRKSKTLKEIDKTSINDAFRAWEKQINDLRFQKEDLLGRLDDLDWGELGGKYIPEPIFKMMEDIITPDPNTFAKQIVAGFKFGKVLMNPATHVRNIISNMTLNYWKLGLKPYDMPIYWTGWKEAKNGGKWVNELKKAKVGYGSGLWTDELKHIFSMQDRVGKKTTEMWGKVKGKLSNAYEMEENAAKLAAYIFQRKKGVGIEEAWKKAMSATFNYSQVTPFVRKLRTSLFGFPFITFGLKAAPLAIETAVTHPSRISVIGKIKKGIENISDLSETEKERANEAPWIKDGFYVKLPIKDKQGRSAYFDLTYILPFGDLVAGDFFTRNINRDTGLPESRVTALMSKSPAINLIKELGRNQDFIGNKIWKDSDPEYKQFADIMRHVSKTYLPPMIADQIPGGYKSNGERAYSGVYASATKPNDKNQKRTLMEEMFRNVGMKIQPINEFQQEQMVEWNRKKALQTLLHEKGGMSSFDILYTPK